MSGALIVAAAQNGVIGRDNDLIWHIPADLKRFKTLTTGKVCIMGRKTFESILAILGKPLPNRTTVIVSRSGFQHERITTCPSLEEALEHAQSISDDEVIVAGGASIYKQALSDNLIDKIYFTRVLEDFEGDAFFELPDLEGWEKIEDDIQDTSPPCQFMTFVKESA